MEKINNELTDVPTEIIGTTRSHYSMIIGVLFILSLFALVISVANYLKTKDEQKKKKAKKVMWRFFVVFTIIFMLSMFWFIILPSTIGLVGVA